MTEVRKLVDVVRVSGLGFSTLVSDPSFVWVWAGCLVLLLLLITCDSELIIACNVC